MKAEFSPYSYELPQDRIAQRPVHPPESAKMLIVQKQADGAHSETGLRDATFEHFVEFISPNDLIVFNNTKVIPARLFGKISGSNVEILLLKHLQASTWLAMGKPGKKLTVDETILFEHGSEDNAETLTARIINRNDNGSFEISFDCLPEELNQGIERIGKMPIPPYIRKGISDDQDRSDYQTIFARINGSIAAPTASLHFSPDLVDKIRDHGTKIAFLTLHVGSASFLPVYRDGKLVPPGIESYECSIETFDLINNVKASGGKIIAVGTTVTRALETMASNGKLGGETDLFITPEYKFKIVDKLVTNFHQPGTTHLLIVEALIGAEKLKQVYEHALNSNYRFLSYGDGMIIG